MKGNIGVHFEDIGYAVTDKKKYLTNLYNAGYTKIAATGRGTFTEYEEVKQIAKELEDKKGMKMEIIPAIRCFYKTPDDTLVLIAKDYEGYLSLCRIITESNALGTVIEHPKKENTADKPIVHLENLRKNVAKGHLFVTTSGADGRIPRLLGKKSRLERRLSQLEQHLHHIKIGDEVEASYEDCIDLLSYYNNLSTVKRPLKKEIEAATKFFEKTGNREDLDDLESRMEEYTNASRYKKLLSDTIKQVKKAIKPYKKEYTEYIDLKSELEDVTNENPLLQAKEEFEELEEIFGKEDTLIELQYHNTEEEKEVLHQMINFGNFFVDNHNFVISNQTRIGTTKEDPDYNNELLRLDVAKYNASNTDLPYQPLTNEGEYCIKTEEELMDGFRPALQDMKSIPDVDHFISSALERTEKKMDECFLEVREMNNHYPKFCDDENAEFIRLCKEGITWRFPNGMPQEYKDRLDKEIDVITSMGYAGYHLIVQDYLKYGRLLGYLDEDEVEDAPLTIEELDQYITERNIKRVGVGIGPGRGSAAGSLCCYLLGITDIDPIKNGLIFERFLNPERVSMPDIDSDFRPQVRLKAREYVREKYGDANVCEIVTKAYQGESGCIHIAARYLAGRQSAKETDSKKVDAIKKHWTQVGDALAKAFQAFSPAPEDEEEGFAAFKHGTFTEEESDIITMVDILKGLFTGYSQHAAGVIISKDNIGNEIPLMWNSSSQSLQTQCQMASAEEKGYLKMDFLGLRNLATISDTVKHPAKEEDITDYCLDANKRQQYILEDPAIYKEVFSKGLTQGIFQFESEGMKQMLKNFQPETFDDIVLLVAAYRPGPMDYIPEIIAQKWYSKDPDHYYERMSKMYPPDDEKYANLYPVPQSSITLKNGALQNILKNTYGCPIYQEQIMQIFQEMAGYSLGRADEVRRAMSKKKVAKLEHERVYFIHGNDSEIVEAKQKLEELKKSLADAPDIQKASIQKQIDTFKIPAKIEGCMAKHGITEEEANDLFEQMMPFAKYGFNKSHAAAYSVVAVETGWCKLYRTADFYCAALNNWKKRDELPKYVADMTQFGIKLLPPSLDCKTDLFKVEDGNIRFPINKVKNVQFHASDYEADSCLQKFIQKNPKATDKVIEKLIRLNCFDQCWNFNSEKAKVMEKQRVNGSVAVMLKWLKENYSDVSKFYALKGDAKEAMKNTLNQRALADCGPGNYKIAQRMNIEVLSDRATEYDLTGHIFSVEDDLKKIQGFKNQNTFKDLDQTSKDNLGIPCVVLNIGAEKYTKSGNVFYPAMLMDRTGEIREFRFDMKLKAMMEEKKQYDGTYSKAQKPLYGTYLLPKMKYFICRKVFNDQTANYKQGLETSLSKAKSGQDFSKAFPKQNPMLRNAEKYSSKEEEMEL